ncbi:MAG: 4'-phosphopantetheinyl transferase superfamily protein [Crocinitomicaceae bacterium]
MNEFIFKDFTLHGTQIHLCSYTEFDPLNYIEYLTDVEKQRLLSFKHIRRRREFIAIRILRHRTIGLQHIHYDVQGAPYIDGEEFISISHSVKEVGLAINAKHKIGLDLESIRPSVKSIMHKFLSENEKIQFDTENIVELCKVWSAKEALYKLAGRKKIHFKSELLINRASETLWEGTIINSDHDISVKLNIFEHNHTIITINTEAIVEHYREI